jgi:hypothetical protein
MEMGLLVPVTNGLMSSRSGTRKVANGDCSGSFLVSVVLGGGGASGGIGRVAVLVILFLLDSVLGCFFLQNASRSSSRVIFCASLPRQRALSFC